MKRLYYQFYLTIVASLVLVVIVGGGLWNLIDHDAPSHRRFELIGELIAAALAPPDAPIAEQRDALKNLGVRLSTDLSLYDRARQLIASAGDPIPLHIEDHDRGGWYHSGGRPTWTMRLPDGRWISARLPGEFRFSKWGLVFLLGGVALAVALAAFPVARRVTRRLERLQRGVERLGAGDLSARVDVKGRDEIAQLAESFNSAAGRIEELVDAHKMLLANASHELRTPLARIRMGVELLKDGADPDRKLALETDIAELDRLIEEILLSSRLDAGADLDSREDVDLLALAAEECARYEQCDVSGAAVSVIGDPRLLRHLLRNLLDNAARHGAPPVIVEVSMANNAALLRVCDAGPAIPEAEREAIFLPFRRTAASNGSTTGSGIGLALVRQIANRHGGDVIYRATAQGSCFEVTLPRDGANPTT